MERLIDATAFFKSFSINLFGSLWTCQIDKMKVSDFCVNHSILCMLGFNLHGEYRMASWACLIVACGTYMSALWSLFQYIQSLISLENSLLRNSFHVHTFLDIFTNLQVAIILRIEQVNNLLIINFKKWTANNVLWWSLFYLQVNRLEKILQSSWNQPS